MTATPGVERPDVTAGYRPGTATTSTGAGTGRGIGLVLLLAGLVGLVASMTLTIEKFKLVTDPFYVPSCTLNAVLTCTEVMQSDQASLFGFPNPLIGIATFPVVAALGALVLARVQLPRWVWLSLQAGVVLAMVFVVWLISQTLYVIGALCPYCMVVWASVIPLFWCVSARNVRAGAFGAAAAGSALARRASVWLPVALVLSYGTVITLALLEFGDRLF